MPAPLEYKPLYRDSIIYPEIEKWLNTRQMSMKRFSELIGVSYNHTVRILHGYNEPRMNIVRKILKVTGLSFENAFCRNIPLKCQRHVFCYRQTVNHNRKWKIYWPNFEKLSKERNLRWDDIAMMVDVHGPYVKRMLINENGVEPNMSLYFIKKFLEATNDTFEHLFALPEE